MPINPVEKKPLFNVDVSGNGGGKSETQRPPLPFYPSRYYVDGGSGHVKGDVIFIRTLPARCGGAVG